MLRTQLLVLWLLIDGGKVSHFTSRKTANSFPGHFRAAKTQAARHYLFWFAGCIYEPTFSPDRQGSATGGRRLTKDSPAPFSPVPGFHSSLHHSESFHSFKSVFISKLQRVLHLMVITVK